MQEKSSEIAAELNSGLSGGEDLTAANGYIWVMLSTAPARITGEGIGAVDSHGKLSTVWAAIKRD